VIGLIGDLGILVPIRGEHTLASLLGEGDVEPSNSTEQVYELESRLDLVFKDRLLDH
jgi:hypothetical protein